MKNVSRKFLNFRSLIAGSAGGLLLVSAINANAVASCNGYAATQNFMSESQLTKNSAGDYQINGTSGNDVIVVDIPTLTGNLAILVERSGLGIDSICVTTNGQVNVSGGQYLKAKAKSIYSNGQNYMELTGQVFLIDTTKSFTTDSTIIVHNSNSYDDVFIQGSSGKDNILVETSGAVTIDTGTGDDTVTVRSGTFPRPVIVIGGEGNNIITTGDAKDIVFGGSVIYSNQVFNGFPVRDFFSLMYQAGAYPNNSNDTSFIAALSSNPLSNASATISTGSGNDIIVGSNGNDTCLGGTGWNTWSNCEITDRLTCVISRNNPFGGGGNYEATITNTGTTPTTGWNIKFNFSSAPTKIVNQWNMANARISGTTVVGSNVTRNYNNGAIPGNGGQLAGIGFQTQQSSNVSVVSCEATLK